MDAGSLIGSSVRLWDAFERMGVSQGEGLVSSGPSPAPKELVREFEKLMAQEHSPQAIQNTSPSADYPEPVRPYEPLRTEAIEGTRLADGTERVQKTQEASQSDVDAPRRGEAGQPVDHIQFYQIQFQVGMLRQLAEAGSQVSKQASQGMDSLLRQQS